MGGHKTRPFRTNPLNPPQTKGDINEMKALWPYTRGTEPRYGPEHPITKRQSPISAPGAHWQSPPLAARMSQGVPTEAYLKPDHQSPVPADEPDKP